MHANISKLPKLDHLAIAVEDLEKAIEWYCSGLGYMLVERRHTQGANSGMISAVLKGEGVPLVLVQGTEPQSQVSQFIKHFGPGVQHIGICVEDVNMACESIAGLGTRPEFATIEGDGIRQVFLENNGCSGVRVELIERNGGDFNDRSVEQLFRKFEAKGAY